MMSTAVNVISESVSVAIAHDGSHLFPGPAAPADPVLEVVSTGVSMAGNTFTLTCNVTLPQQLRETPAVVWIGPDGMEIGNGTVEGVTVSLSSPLTKVLTFSPLRTSHGGVYTCRASVTIPLAGVSIGSSSQTTVTVQSQFIL